ncbi:endothelin-converting enzyme 1-like [Haemaphysalis longicornis]
MSQDARKTIAPRHSEAATSPFSEGQRASIRAAMAVDDGAYSTPEQTQSLVPEPVSLGSWTCCLTVVFVAIISAVFLVAIAMALIAPGDARNHPKHKTGVDKQICTKKRCNWLEHTLSQFSPDSAPCQDSYGHVCKTRSGQWLSRTKNMDFDVNRGVTRLLRQPLRKHKQGSATHKAVSLYKACVRILRRENSEISDLRSFMRNVGLDLLDGGAKSKKDAVDILCALFFRYGVNTLLSFVMHDLISVNGKKLVSIGFSENFDAWFVRREKLMRDSRITHFYVHYVNAYSKNSDSETWEVLSRVSRADSVASALLAAYHSKRDEPFTRLKVRHLSRHTPKTVSRQQWIEAISTHSRSVYTTDDILYVKPSALKFFGSLLSQLNHDGVKYQMAWCLLRNYGSYSDRRLIRSVALHNQTCLERVATVMGPALYAAYIFRAVSPKAIQRAIGMALNIKAQAQTDVARASWLPRKEKRQALRRMRSLNFHVGFPNGMTTVEELDRYYQNYPAAPRHFLLSWMRASKITRARKLGNRNILLPHRGFPTAAYFEDSNTVFISADLLRPPVFLASGPDSFNYGGLGQIIAHEVIHAFLLGTQSKEIRKGGDSSAELHAVEEKTRCLNESHREALEGGMPSQVNSSHWENVADFAGAALAFRTFHSLKTRNTTLEAGPPEDEQQLFFVGLCLKHCERDDYDQSLFTPSPLRCTMQVKNMPEFSTAFKCNAGDTMNPYKKCAAF